MMEIRLTAYQKYSLEDLMQRVSDDYYMIISRLSGQIREYTMLMDPVAQGDGERLYLMLNAVWASELDGYIKHRNEVFMPYLLELAEKETAQHNCTQCSGKCDMQHTSRIIEFIHTLELVKGKYVSYTDGLKGLPEVIDSPVLDAMNTTMAFLNQHVHQLWRVELDCVLPKIKEAQRSINAHS